MAIFNVQFQNNNVTYKDGDSLIISFDGPFNNVNQFTSYTESTSPDPTSEDYFLTNVRWSIDFQTWSSWIPLTQNVDGSKSLPNIDFTSGSSIYLEFKYIRVSDPESSPTPLSIIGINIEYTIHSTESVQIQPPGKICPMGEYYKGIKVNCEGNTFRIYDLMEPAIQLNRELALSVSEMFGWNVCYFKVSSDERTKDVILKEYSLYNVSDVKNVRVIVPDNQFPENQINFTPFDLDFETGFEVHIVKEDFERAFGYCVKPEERDYLYFPIENRMYKIESPFLFKDFMRAGVYYKMNLVKWQDTQNIINVGTTASNEASVFIDDVTKSFDIFNEEKELEFKQITKPKQYNTINLGPYDFIRSEIHQNLKIKKHDINNYFTIIGKYSYDLSSIKYSDLGVKYKTEVNIPQDEDRVIMFWFKNNRTQFQNPKLGEEIINDYPIGSTYEGLKYDVILDGVYDNRGIQIRIQYDNINNSYITSGIEIILDDESYLYDSNYLTNTSNNFPNLLTDVNQYSNKSIEYSRKWIGFVLNISNRYQTMNLNLWEMKFDPTKPAYIQQSTSLELLFGETKQITNKTITSGDYYQLKGWPGMVSNVRLLTKLLNEENQPLVLNQYTLRDNQYAILIDNALPPLKLTRESVR